MIKKTISLIERKVYINREIYWQKAYVIFHSWFFAIVLSICFITGLLYISDKPTTWFKWFIIIFGVVASSVARYWRLTDLDFKDNGMDIINLSISPIARKIVISLWLAELAIFILVPLVIGLYWITTGFIFGFWFNIIIQICLLTCILLWSSDEPKGLNSPTT